MHWAVIDDVLHDSKGDQVHGGIMVLGEPQNAGDARGQQHQGHEGPSGIYRQMLPWSVTATPHRDDVIDDRADGRADCKKLCISIHTFLSSDLICPIALEQWSMPFLSPWKIWSKLKYIWVAPQSRPVSVLSFASSAARQNHFDDSAIMAGSFVHSGMAGS